MKQSKLLSHGTKTCEIKYLSKITLYYPIRNFARTLYKDKNFFFIYIHLHIQISAILAI